MFLSLFSLVLAQELPAACLVTSPAADEAEARTLAVEAFSEARKRKGTPEASACLEAARGRMADYFTRFPSTTYGYEMRYVYGELAYTLKDYALAYEQYQAVIALDVNGKHSQFCAESSIFAAQELVKAEAPTPGTLSKAEEQLIGALRTYATRWPDSPKAKPALYQAAYRLYEDFQFDAAREVFLEAILRWPNDKEALQAANMVLDKLAAQEDWGTLYTTAKALYEIDGLGDEAWRAELKKTIRKAKKRR